MKMALGMGLGLGPGDFVLDTVFRLSVLFTSGLHIDASYGGGLSVELQALIVVSVVLLLVIVSAVVVVYIKKRRKAEAGNTVNFMMPFCHWKTTCIRCRMRTCVR